MAFPTTGILDAFTGTNGDDLPAHDANWSTLAGTTAFEIQGNAATGTTALNGAYRNDISPTDFEVFLTISTRPADTEYVVLSGRFDPATYNGYILTITANAGTDSIAVQRSDLGVATTLGSPINQEIVAGDSFGLGMVGTTLQAYYKASGGSWATLGSPQTDATYAGANRIGTTTNSTTVRVDDFGGGELVLPPVISVQPTDQTGAVGSTVTFNTTVTGAVSFQWQHNDGQGAGWVNTSGGSGATAEDHTPATLVRATHSGRLYRLVATNTGGDTTSNVVLLRVTDIPTSYSGDGLVIGSGYVGDMMVGGPAASSPDVTVALTGVAATTALGSITKDTSVAVTGSASTTALGTLAQGTGVAVTGSVATSALGALAPNSNINVTGSVVTGVVGSVAVLAGDVTVGLTGVAGTLATGTLTPAADKSLSGTVSTGAVGAVTPSIDKALSGSAATTAVGTVTPSADKALSGSAVTGVVGSVSANVAPALTGVGGTGNLGSVTPSADRALTGTQASGQTGTILPQDSVGFTGVAGAGATGNVAAGRSLALTGLSSTGQAGTVGLNITLPLSGISAAGAVGSVGVSLNSDLTLALSGVAATGAVGSVGVSLNSDITLSLTGLGSTAGVGSLGNQRSHATTGAQIASAVGALFADRSLPVINNSTTVQQGSLGRETYLGLSSVTGNGATGNLTTGRTVPVINNSTTVQQGSVTYTPVFGLTGLSAAAGLGLLVYNSNLTLVKVTATGQLGNFIVGVPIAVTTTLYKRGKFQVNLALAGDFATVVSSSKKFQTTKNHTGEF